MASNCSYGSASVAVVASVSGFDPPKESVHVAGITAVAAACTAEDGYLHDLHAHEPKT